MARVLAFDESSTASSPPPPPPAQQPPAAQERAGAVSRPLKRVARFLGDDASSDDDDGGDDGYGAPAYGSDARRGLAMGQKRRTTAQDVDRMFADLDNDDDDDLPAPLQRGGPDGTQESMMDDRINPFGNSKGKGRATNGFDDDGDDATNDKIDAEKAKKPKRKPVLMNEERLLGDKGIRRLKENLKGFKIKGKGHEEDDLRRLMNVYQLWAHQMFPAGSFKDTISQVEKLCKKRSVKGVLKGWRDEAQGKLPPPLAKGGYPDDEGDGPTRHAASDEDDEAEVLAHNRGANGSTTTSQAGSPDRGVPKKSYFDDIPTSSPGGALSRDPEMEEDYDEDLAESLFGSRAPPTAGPSTSRTQNQNPPRMPTSDVGFNDADLDFDLDEDEYDAEMEVEGWFAMRELDEMNDDSVNGMERGDYHSKKGGPSAKKHPTLASAARAVSSAMEFYADPKARASKSQAGNCAGGNVNKQASSQNMVSRQQAADMEEENFDDFDFGNEEDDIMREMELADKKRRDREAAALAAEKRAAENTSSAVEAGTNTSTQPNDNAASTTTSSSKTPSLTTSSSAQEVNFELDDAFDGEFLQGIEESESTSQKKTSAVPSTDAPRTSIPSPANGTSPSKAPIIAGEASGPSRVGAEEAPLYEEEEEDLYS